MSQTIADRMAEAAEEDRSAPYSLMLDAWDLLQSGLGFRDLDDALTVALDAYEADPAGYWTSERIARESGTQPHP